MISHGSHFKFLSRFRDALPRSLTHPALAAEMNARTYKASKSYRSLPSMRDISTFKSRCLITGVRTSKNRKSVEVEFHDATYTFHSQWLHDAQADIGASREAADVYSVKDLDSQVLKTGTTGQRASETLDITWNDGRTSRFPAPWLRVYAPLVAKLDGTEVAQKIITPKGWLARTLTIPEVSYADIFPNDSTLEIPRKVLARIYHSLLHESGTGIMKVVALPAPVMEDERAGKNTLVTQILVRLFGSVFVHPRRGPDLTFNIASHHEKDASKARTMLPNYDTTKKLLPHADQSHYLHPTRVNSLYNLEGESENTFVSCTAALATLEDETPHLLEHLRTAPMAMGRVAHWYQPSLYQATIDTAITAQPGSPNRAKRFRWHPHLMGGLLSPYDTFPEALAAHRKFQEIMRRTTHELKVTLRPGDLYLWDNFRVLHGRESVLKLPRTSVGQSVSEQVAADRYREFKMRKLLGYFDERWLIQMPETQLDELEKMVDTWETWDSAL